MKKETLFTLICCCGLGAVAQAQDLQTVTNTGNTTNRFIQITGANGVTTTGAGLELYANPVSATGYLKAYNRTAGVPGLLKIQDSGGDTHINPAGGNVGIGTATPTARLDVAGNIKVSDGMQTINLVNGTSTASYSLSLGLNDDGVNFSNSLATRGFKFNNANGNLFLVNSGGNMGIGTLTPMNGTNNLGLHISKGNHSTIVLGEPAGGYGGFVQTSDSRHRVFIGANAYDDVTNSWQTVQAGKGLAGISIVADEGGWGTSIDFFTSTGSTFTKSMTILGNGNVGIGTLTPGACKLAVDGLIGARRIKVTQAAWADFVFHPEYKLPSLGEVELFINKHQHLPDIPAEKEVVQDGLDLGDMNKKLLQKIEELTLYMIEEHKKNQQQERLIQQLQEEIKQLKNR